MSTQNLQAVADRYCLSPPPEKIVPLYTVGGLLGQIARAAILQDGFYTCTRDGVRILVLPDEVLGL